MEQAQEEAARLQEKVESGVAQDLDKAEKIVDKENRDRSEIAKNYVKRFNEKWASLRESQALDPENQPVHFLQSLIKFREDGHTEEFPYSNEELANHVDSALLDLYERNVKDNPAGYGNFVEYISSVIKHGIPFNKEKLLELVGVISENSTDQAVKYKAQGLMEAIKTH